MSRIRRFISWLKNAKVPANCIYANGDTAMACDTDLPISGWPKLVETWLQTIHMVLPQTH
jgi:hypothetical protein